MKLVKISVREWSDPNQRLGLMVAGWKVGFHKPFGLNKSGPVSLRECLKQTTGRRVRRRDGRFNKLNRRPTRTDSADEFIQEAEGKSLATCRLRHANLPDEKNFWP